MKGEWRLPYLNDALLVMPKPAKNLPAENGFIMKFPPNIIKIKERGVNGNLRQFRGALRWQRVQEARQQGTSPWQFFERKEEEMEKCSEDCGFAGNGL